MSATVELSTAPSVLASIRSDIRLSVAEAHEIDLTFAVQILRRLCEYSCPCTREHLLRVAEASLRPLAQSEDRVKALLRQALEAIVVGADIVEIPAGIGSASADRDLLYCSPPSFVRKGNRLYVFGISPDERSPVPEAIWNKIAHLGGSRYIDDASAEIAETLKQFGLREVQPDGWLAPKRRITTAEAYYESLEKMLSKLGGPAAFQTFTVLRHADGVERRYRERWRNSERETGLHVIRIEGAYGSRAWYVAELKMGSIVRALRLPSNGYPDRACDNAWDIQLAIDARNGKPAQIRSSAHMGGVLLSATFPLPLSATRQLIYLGGHFSEATGSRGAIWLPKGVWEQEQKTFKEWYWIAHEEQERRR